MRTLYCRRGTGEGDQHVVSEEHRSDQGPRHLRSRRCRQAAGLAELGFRNTHQQSYIHKDKGRVLDLHFQKDGSDLFAGWKAEECSANLAAIDTLFGNVGIKVAPRVMSLAEAYS
jgi:hypothetical protein